jgi:pyrroloquinoline quinone biosynthesis protein E
MTTATATPARPDSRPGLRRGVVLAYDQARAQHAVLYPEGVLLLNETAAAVLARCDGARTVAAIAADLATVYEGVCTDDLRGLVTRLAQRRLLTLDGPGAGAQAGPPPVRLAAAPAVETRRPMPFGLLAEVTYRCPLHCAYCSNPVELARYRDELDLTGWRRALDAAREIGVLQVHLSGGEPLARRDLADLVAHARGLGMYTSLVTSGIPLPEARLDALVEAGLDHVQLSVQDAQAASADEIAGIRAHERKREVATLVTARGLPLTVNVVLHRANIAHLLPIAALAAELGADRLELANTQYYGWALRNWAALLPSREQVEAAKRDAAAARDRFGAAMEIVYVAADYYETRPKPCLYGWGSRQLIIAPDGDVLPCPAAGQIPDLGVRSVRDTPLGEIWYSSPAFTRFRGTAWMPEPCQSCELRDVDFGGCRCQAYQLTGDAAATDPVCDLSPHHGVMAELVATGPAPAVVPRRMR